MREGWELNGSGLLVPAAPKAPTVVAQPNRAQRRAVLRLGVVGARQHQRRKRRARKA